MDRRIIKTRHAIQQALFSIIREPNMKRITISEIARRAGIDRKTFYLHYDTVEDIFNAFCQEKIDELMKLLQDAHFFEDSFNSTTFFQSLNTIIEPDIEVYRALVANNEYDFFWDQIQRKIVRTIIDMYVDSTSLSTEQMEIYMSFYAAGFVSTYVKWLRKEYSVSLDELSRMTTELAYSGAQMLLTETIEES